MDSNNFKNISDRKRFNSLEFKKIIYKFIFINLLSNKELFTKNKNFLHYFLQVKNNVKNFSKIQIKNKCVLTGRNRSVNKNFSISRAKFRNLIRFGLISGYYKSVW
jgi:small subunit ribosomal protein S14